MAADSPSPSRSAERRTTSASRSSDPPLLLGVLLCHRDDRRAVVEDRAPAAGRCARRLASAGVAGDFDQLDVPMTPATPGGGLLAVVANAERAGARHSGLPSLQPRPTPVRQAGLDALLDEVVRVLRRKVSLELRERPAAARAHTLRCATSSRSRSVRLKDPTGALRLGVGLVLVAIGSDTCSRLALALQLLFHPLGLGLLAGVPPRVTDRAAELPAPAVVAVAVHSFADLYRLVGMA